ncbi:MAG: hypothetical protein Q7K54_06330 [Candidatus Parcubacteria bacterium]|nr:hypothetical protein [Candidatus Parcubacteria bacterium]
MITIFSIPKPFQGSINITQRNAILSWTLLEPKCEIILFNDEKGTTSKVAKELGVECINNIQRNKDGLPLLSDVFEKVYMRANNKILAYVNSDIILMDDFLEAVKALSGLKQNTNLNFNEFLMLGRRWNLDIKEEINFNNNNWKQALKELINKEGKLQGLSGTDYWIFPRTLKFKIPLFVVGQRGFENWFIYKARSLKVQVLDATKIINVIHQNHSRYLRRSNQAAANFSEMCTLRDVDWILTSEGLQKPAYSRRIFATLSLFYPWRLILSIKRKLQNLAITI